MKSGITTYVWHTVNHLLSENKNKTNPPNPLFSMSFEEGERTTAEEKKNKMEKISSTDMLERNYLTGYLQGSWTPSLSLFHNIDWIPTIGMQS